MGVSMKLEDVSIFKSIQEMKNPEEFHACLQAHGLYHNKQFVVRLSPLNHSNMLELTELSKMDGMLNLEDAPPEYLFSYGTYIHENIHWWQHKGSICGLMRSMAQISYTHNNLDRIRDLHEHVGGIKPLFKWWHNQQNLEDSSDERVKELANIIINDFVDIEFYLLQSYNPQRIRDLKRDPYYKSSEHSAIMVYLTVLADFTSNVDKSYKVFPDKDQLQNRYEKELERREGSDSPLVIHISPLGLLDVIEGQARMVQLQYLRGVLGVNSLMMAKDKGYLENEYGRAFIYFIEQIKEDLPSEVDSPLVALFLLLCDIALNPDKGFISDVIDFNSFYESTDPGYRFVLCCTVIANKLPHLKNRIKLYSKSEYIEVSDEICKECGFLAPYTISKKISEWEAKNVEIEKLMKEHKKFKFTLYNIPTRLMLSEFIALNKDKADSPEFFCWPGMYLYGSNTSQECKEKWLSHTALFHDSEHSETIVPRYISGCEKKEVKDTFNQFYAAILVCDFLRQWIIRDGEFDLSFKWLTNEINPEELHKVVESYAERQFSIRVEEFKFFTDELYSSKDLIGTSLFMNI